jgi:hypothetical protein
MRIDKRLNLVIPVERADGAMIYVHSTPISVEVFDTYFLVIAKTFGAIYSEGLGVIAGPRVADKLLRKVAQDMGAWEGAGGVRDGLVAEMRRLSNVLSPGAQGWEMLPFDDAKARGVIDAADAAEIEAAITFFTVASAMHRRTDQADILGSAMSLWGARIESLSCTELMNSLRTSTVAASSGATAA